VLVSGAYITYIEYGVQTSGPAHGPLPSLSEWVFSRLGRPPRGPGASTTVKACSAP
jgi:hypothetical protein